MQPSETIPFAKSLCFIFQETDSKLRKNKLQNFDERICKAAVVIFDMI